MQSYPECIWEVSTRYKRTAAESRMRSRQWELHHCSIVYTVATGHLPKQQVRKWSRCAVWYAVLWLTRRDAIKPGVFNTDAVFMAVSYCTRLFICVFKLRRSHKGKALDIAPLRSESPQQKRSDMARVLKGFHSFTCTHTHTHTHVYPQSEWAISAFAFPAITGTHLPTPEGWKAE